jgi:ribonuclease-3
VQEWLQARQKPLPDYALVEAAGEEHERSFRIRASTADPVLHAEGIGSSRRAAEQQAAGALLGLLEEYA